MRDLVRIGVKHRIASDISITDISTLFTIVLRQTDIHRTVSVATSACHTDASCISVLKLLSWSCLS